MKTKVFSPVLLICAVLLLAFIAAACGRSAVPTPDPSPTPASSGEPLPVGKSENGSRVELKTGELLRIQLEANPSTGFSWQVSQVNENILLQQGDAQYASDAPAGIVGGSGWQLILFKAISPGETTLELDYLQPWVQDVAPEQTFRVTVVVVEK